MGHAVTVGQPLQAVDHILTSGFGLYVVSNEG